MILVDYDDGIAGNGMHDTAVRNGGFESPDTGVDGEPFSNTDYWVNAGGDQSAEARRTNIADTGSFSSVNGESRLVFALDTEHTIAAGDSFAVEFRSRRAYLSDATSTITAELYYTADDTVDGAASVLGTVTATAMATSFATYGDAFAAIPAGSDAVDRNLFLRFSQSAGPGYTRTDGWYVTATPEPATMGLLALGGLALLRRRRRAA